MLNYAQVRWESYYAHIYAGIMCQGLLDSCSVLELTVSTFILIYAQVYNDLNFLTLFANIMIVLVCYI